MRYNVHSPCAFHSRSARYLVVLVGAALIATLGLPSAVQAQTPPAPTVTGMGDGEVDSAAATIEAEWFGPATVDGRMGWLLEYTEPKVAWSKATKVVFGTSINKSGTIPANDPRIHHGVWKFRVSYYDRADDDEPGKVVGRASALTDYLHGPPDAPTDLMAHDAGPDARRLVWDDVAGAESYELRYSSDPTDDDEWTDWDDATSGMVIDDLDMGVEYTFEVRALSASRAGVGDLHGPSTSTMEMMPTPTPTLPEIAALFLAMLLLGSGAYLLRRRQSGGLTPA